jgi:hypothetical protein
MLIERLSYKGLPNCCRLSNGVIELIVTEDVGIRIIRFGFVNDRNEFFEADPLELPADRDKWVFYGGHRLWHAPEISGRTDAPDNAPVTVEDHGDFVRLIQTLDVTGIEKQIDIRLAPESANVELTHRLINRSLWAVELAVWALSVMSPGGTAIIPLPPRGTHPQDLLPTSTITLWAYADLSDPRFRFGRKYIYVRQDSSAATPQKIGVSVPDGWAAYANNGHVFVKQVAYVPSVTYPDFGSSIEVFTNTQFIELESLSPVVTLPASSAEEHVERWTLIKDAPAISGDDDVDQYVLPLVTR